MGPEGKPRKRRKQHEPALFPKAERPQRVLVTGATGFVGSAVVRELLVRGFEVVALARRLPPCDGEPRLIRVAADVTAPGWERWVEGCSAAIHLVGIIRERPGVTFRRAHVDATARVVEACQALGIGRLVHISAVGARLDAATPYHRTKAEAEELVRSSGLAWTIIRPSVIFGPGDGFTTTLANVIRRFPVVPVFGDGSYPLQPVAVEDVAEVFAACLENPEAERRVLELGGPEVLTYVEVLRRVASSLGKRRAFIRIPLAVARPLVHLATTLLANPPITTDELTMLVSGSVADTTLVQKLFGLPRKTFAGVTWLPSPGETTR